MNLVESFNLLGTEAKQIPCLKGSGAPTELTEGAVGCFYMDTDTGMVYKCTAADDGIYTWEIMGTQTQCRTAIVIGNAADGATADTCDVLYTEDDSFDETLQTAYEMCIEKSIKTIELLQGDYNSRNSVVFNKDIDIVGVGMPYIYIEYSFNHPPTVAYVQDAEKVKISNVKFGAWNGESIDIRGKAATLKDVVTEGNVNVVGSNTIITGCNIESISGDYAENCIVANNIVGSITLNEETNVIEGNIINGVPQVSGGGEAGEITLTAENETPVLGGELATADGWTSDGWTGDFATGFTHTSGNTSPLSFNIPDITAGKSYVIAFKCSDAFTNTNILVTIGDAPASPIYGIANDKVIQWGVKAEDTGALTFIPESAFTGTLSEISIKEITDLSTPYMSVYDTDNNTPIEQRTGKEDLQNIFIGKGVGGKNVSGFDNYILGGDNTFQNNISGFWNIAIGQQTLHNNVSGSRNVSIGRSNLLSNISGTRNICIGTYVLTKAKKPNHNVVIGADAMNLATGSENNVAIGFQAMYNNTEGSHNVAVGNGAGLNNTTGKNNVFIGSGSAVKNTTGNNNMCIGTGTLQLNETGSNNVVIGANALYKGTAPKENVAIGNEALKGTTSTGGGGTRNVAIGYGAIKNETAVHNTIAIGYNTGVSLTTGRENIIIGTGCDLPAGSNYKLNIGNLLKGDLTAGSAYLDVNGGLQLNNIPTSDPNIAGRVWNDNGTLKISTGA